MDCFSRLLQMLSSRWLLDLKLPGPSVDLESMVSRAYEGAWSFYLLCYPSVCSRHPFFPFPAHELEGVGVLLHLHYGPRAWANLPSEGSTVTRKLLPTFSNRWLLDLAGVSAMPSPRMMLPVTLYQI